MTEDIKVKFKKRASSWCVVIDGDEIATEHNGQIEYARSLEHIEAVAGRMADIVKRAILAMPENGAKRIQFDCSWK